MKTIAKVNPHFHEFLTDWSRRIYFLVGGYGSGKSYHVALKIVLKLLSERRTALVVRETFESIRDSCYSLFATISAALNLDVIRFTRSPMQINFPNGSKIIFRGLDKVEKLKSIHDVSLVWIEEAAEISAAAFKELQGRLRHPTLPLFMILSTNPVARSNWTFKHFFERVKLDDERLYTERTLQVGDVYYHHSVAADNFFLPPNYNETLREMQSYDPDLFRIAYLGRFGVSGKRVLPQFEIMPHAEVISAVEKIPRRFKFTGLDFGFVESFNAVIRCAVDNERKFLFVYWEFYGRGITDDVFADKLIASGIRETIRCDSAEPKAIAYLKKRGLKTIAAHKWNGGTRHARLDNTRKIKRFKKIFVSDACPNCARELGELTFKIDRNGDIIEDEFNIDAHTFSAIWYALDTYDITDVKKLSRGDLGL